MNSNAGKNSDRDFGSKIRKFKRKYDDDGVQEDMRSRESFSSKSEERRRAKKASQRRKQNDDDIEDSQQNSSKY